MTGSLPSRLRQSLTVPEPFFGGIAQLLREENNGDRGGIGFV
jgi:hypothetical protein